MLGPKDIFIIDVMAGSGVNYLFRYGEDTGNSKYVSG